MSYDFDVIVIGSGPAGYSCSMQAAKYGKRVLVIEASLNEFGGAWINTGTVPSKALREAAYTIYKFHRFIHSDKKPYQEYKLTDLLKFKDDVLNHENKSAKNYFIKNDIKTIHGFASLKDEHTVNVETHFGQNQEFTSEFILLATGSKPLPPKKFDLDHDRIRDSVSLLNLDHFPRRLLVIGSGIHAMEYASIFAAMGTIVTILNEHDTYLTLLDDEIRNEFTTCMDDLGIKIINRVQVEKVDFNPLRNKTEVRFLQSENNQIQVIETDQVLYIGGRIPNTSKLNLGKSSVIKDDEGFIKVDSNYKTSSPSIFAAGDIIGYPGLASASFSQGRLAACSMFDISKGEISATIPYSIYTIPEISSVGLTEKEALDLGHNVTIGRSFYTNLTRAQFSSASRGLLKLVIDTESLELLGVHIIGEAASEIIHIGQGAINHKEKVHYFIRNIMNYPSYAQAYRTAAFNGFNKAQKVDAK